MRKCVKILSIILLVFALVLSLFACRTGAFWRGQGNDTRSVDADIEQTNGSEKYIVYAALNASGEPITPPEVGDPEATEAYAVVGYTGLVAELTIPAQYDGKDVTKVIAAPTGSNYLLYRDVDSLGAPIPYTGDDARLRNNPVVTSIVFGSNVASVGAGVCVGMVNLTSVSFARTSGVVVGASAFSACYALTSVSFACEEASASIGSGNFSGVTPTYAS